MNTIMNTAEFIRVTDLLKKEKIAKNSGNIFAAIVPLTVVDAIIAKHGGILLDEQ